jgi:hypothetical protein
MLKLLKARAGAPAWDNPGSLFREMFLPVLRPRVAQRYVHVTKNRLAKALTQRQGGMVKTGWGPALGRAAKQFHVDI